VLENDDEAVVMNVALYKHRLEHCEYSTFVIGEREALSVLLEDTAIHGIFDNV